LPGAGISRARQEALVKGGFEAVRAGDLDISILHTIGELWEPNGNFASVPDEMNRALAMGEEQAWQMLLCVSYPPGRIDRFLKVDELLESTDYRLLIITVNCLSKESLLKHRESCMGMLQRKEAPPRAKRVLLERIAADRSAKAWFTGREGILESLTLDSDADLQKAAKMALDQTRSSESLPVIGTTTRGFLGLPAGGFNGKGLSPD
jgi:hypothetical protein